MIRLTDQAVFVLGITCGILSLFTTGFFSIVMAFLFGTGLGELRLRRKQAK